MEPVRFNLLWRAIVMPAIAVMALLGTVIPNRSDSPPPRCYSAMEFLERGKKFGLIVALKDDELGRSQGFEFKYIDNSRDREIIYFWFKLMLSDGSAITTFDIECGEQVRFSQIAVSPSDHIWGDSAAMVLSTYFLLIHLGSPVAMIVELREWSNGPVRKSMYQIESTRTGWSSTLFTTIDLSWA